MKKKYKILLLNFLIIVLAAFTAGCWDAIDINEKLIITTVAFDLEGEEMKGYLETANIQASQGANTSQTNAKKFNVISTPSKTIIESRAKLETKLDKPVFLSGVNTLVLTEDFANKYLIEYLYRFRADEFYRKKGNVVFTKQSPEELFKVAQEKDVSLGMFLSDMVDTLEKEGRIFLRSSERLIENLSSPYSGILILNAGTQDNEIAILGYSVVKDNKVAGFIPIEEANGLLLMKSKNPKLSYDVPYKDLKLTIEVTSKKPKIKPFYKDGKISFDLKFDCKAKLMYGDKKTPYDLTDKDMKKIGDFLSEMLKNELENTVAQAQNTFNCDYLQFDDIFRIKYPEDYEKLDWENEFSKISITIDVNVDMSTTYMMDYNTGEPK